MNASQLLYALHCEVSEPLAIHILLNAMIHAGGWWNPQYTHTPLPQFFNLETR